MEVIKKGLNDKEAENAYKKQIRLLKQVWKKDGGAKEVFGIERLVMLFLLIVSFILPITLIRWLSGLIGYSTRKKVTEFYAVVKVVLLLYILMSGKSKYLGSAIVSCVFLVDLYVYILGLVFLGKLHSESVSYGRSLILLIVNFVESVCSFAVLYIYTGSIIYENIKVTGWHMAVYFSMVTASTVGYGDMIAGNKWGRLLILLQIMSTFLFVTCIFTSYVGKFFSDQNQVDLQKEKTLPNNA